MNSIVKKVIGLACAALVLFGGYFLLLPPKEVTIIDNGKITTVKSKADDVHELLFAEGITIGDHDRIVPAADEPVYSGMTVEIQRAKKVTVVADGEERQIWTTEKKVEDVLEQAAISYDENDRIIPGLEEDVAERICVIGVEIKEVTETKEIPYRIEKVSDDSLYQGEHRINKKGQKGLEEYIYQVVLEDGEETGRKLLERTVVKKPVTEIVAVGTLQIAARGGLPLSFKQTMTMSATAYTHTGNRTYTGKWPAKGTVAVDPGIIPLGSRLYIEGYGYATAMDIGSAIKGNRIDLFFETRSEAFRWGRRLVQVFILE